MTLTVREARQEDVADLCALLNEIIAIGGTTAFQHPWNEADFEKAYLTGKYCHSCVVAEQGGTLLGFQSLEWSDPDWDGADPLPDDWLIIATFSRVGRTKGGIGTAMFAETLKSARQTNAVAIDATIRANNAGGLAYYNKMGFRDYARVIDEPSADKTCVDRIRKRFDL